MSDGTTAFRILITDDDPDLLFTLRTQLESDGYDVQATSNGEAALAAAEKTLPHLAVLDLLMPGMSGVEVVGAIIKSCPTTRVVLLTSSESAKDLLAAVKAGA